VVQADGVRIPAEARLSLVEDGEIPGQVSLLTFSVMYFFTPLEMADYVCLNTKNNLSHD
jgi:hypothetical protein